MSTGIWLDSVRKVAQKQKITSQSMEDRDIIAMAKDERDAVVQVFFVRDGKLIGREHFHMNLTGSESKAGNLKQLRQTVLRGNAVCAA